MSTTQEEQFEDDVPLKSVSAVSEEMMGDDEIGGEESEGEGEKKRGRKKGKATPVKTSKGVGNARFGLFLDMENFQDSLESFQQLLNRINAKNIGREIFAEEVFAKLLDKIDDDFILALQKESLTEDEMNIIFRSHFSNASLQ